MKTGPTPEPAAPCSRVRVEGAELGSTKGAQRGNGADGKTSEKQLVGTDAVGRHGPGRHQRYYAGHQEINLASFTKAAGVAPWLLCHSSGQVPATMRSSAPFTVEAIPQHGLKRRLANEPRPPAPQVQHPPVSARKPEAEAAPACFVRLSKGVLLPRSIRLHYRQ